MLQLRICKEMRVMDRGLATRIEGCHLSLSLSFTSFPRL